MISEALDLAKKKIYPNRIFFPRSSTPGEGRKTKRKDKEYENTERKNTLCIIISQIKLNKTYNALFFFFFFKKNSRLVKTSPVHGWGHHLSTSRVQHIQEIPNPLFPYYLPTPPVDFSPLFLDYPRVSAKIHGRGNIHASRATMRFATNPISNARR